MANYGAMIWLETRAGTSTLTPITATTYPSNEFNTNGDNIQAKASFPYVYYTSTGSLTEALQGSINSATNSAQPTTMDKISIDPTTHKSMGLNATFDYRANTLKKVFSPIEDVTSNLKSTGTTSEVCWNIVGVTDQAVVPNSIGNEIDFVLSASITSGTVNTTLTNFPLVFDNSLTTLPNPLYEIVKADVCSPVGANKLLFSGIKFSNIVHALPLIPRSSNLTPVSPLNNIPSGFIFDSNTPPEIQLLSSNSATADIVVNFYLKKR
jgi:hypothetical protein